MAVNSFGIGYGFLHCSRNNETGFGGLVAGKSVAGKQGLVARFWEELKEGKKTSGLSGGGDVVVWLAENAGKKKDEVAVLEMPRYDFGNMSTGLDQI